MRCPVALQTFEAIAKQSPQFLHACSSVQGFAVGCRATVETLILRDKFAARENFGSIVTVAQIAQ
jgi:hypothetical protein